MDSSFVGVSENDPKYVNCRAVRVGWFAGAIALSCASTVSMAAVVCNNTAISIPANIDGVYLNLVTGAPAMPARA